MNKILIGKKIISDSPSVVVDNNKITLTESSEYFINYVDQIDYEIIFNIYNDVKIFESSFDCNLDIDNHYIINDGSVEITKFYNNTRVTEKINIDLCGDGSSVNYKFSNICKEIENYEINIYHKAKDTASNVINKSVALKNSDIKFVINSYVYKDSYRAIINQNTRIVTMGECNAAISPNMFIDLDDASAKHGSIIGTFKEEDIFYLMNKGISYNDTLKLLVKGYLFSNLGEHTHLREKVFDIINMYWR